MEEHYNPQTIEQKIQADWEVSGVYAAHENTGKENTTVCPCFLILAANCTWAMSAITP